MQIILQRIYDDVPQAGYRVLVDRLWPRGMTKEKAALDEWCKELAPSPALRVWYDHKPERWLQFGKEYRQELKKQEETAKALLRRAGRKKLVLLYAAKDTQHANAVVLKKFLENLKG
jgi:uncharacterized protein YeaO (DUF488 family)